MNADSRTDEQILEALDFDHEIPCEYPVHRKIGDGSAIYLIHEEPGACSPHRRAGEFVICAGCWVHAGREGLRCECGANHARDEAWRIVRVIGGGS